MQSLLNLATVVGILSAVTIGDDKQPRFKIATKQDTDKVEVKVERDRTIFSVHGPVGISQAAIERTDEKRPDNVMLRLHLKGLESFRVANGMATLDAAVSSHDDKPRVRLWKDGKENVPLDAKSPFWMEIRMIGDDGKPATSIPLKDGYFEMHLPKAFFEGNPRSIMLNWIDFYRN